MSYDLTIISPVSEIPAVEEGSVWEWLVDVDCRSGHTIPKGSKAKVVKRTGLAPYGEIMDRGYNLLIEAANGITIWATFEQCVSRGLLRKVKSNEDGLPAERSRSRREGSSEDEQQPA
jgi:hypothetical protein